MVLGMAPRASHVLGEPWSCIPAPAGTSDFYMLSGLARDYPGQNVLFLQCLRATTVNTLSGVPFGGLLGWGLLVPSLPYCPGEGSAVASLGSPPFFYQLTA